MRKHNKNSCDWIAGSSPAMTTALLITTALFSFDARAATEECVEAPSCTDLGYTHTAEECLTGSVKCPWNTGLVYCECNEDYKYRCDDDNETAGTDKCGNYYAACDCDDGYIWKNGACVSSRPSCNIGYIFYTDNTCSADVVSGKTVLGIVVHNNNGGIGGQIMTPWPVDANGNKTSSNSAVVMWGGYGTDISSLPNYTSDSSASKDYNSCGNTDKIVVQGNASTYPAAWAARRYAPTTDTAGKWCLPAGGIMININNNLTTFENAISKIGGIDVLRFTLWSSSEISSDEVWYADFNTISILDIIPKENLRGGVYTTTVRPVLEF